MRRDVAVWLLLRLLSAGAALWWVEIVPQTIFMSVQQGMCVLRFDRCFQSHRARVRVVSPLAFPVILIDSVNNIVKFIATQMKRIIYMHGTHNPLTLRQKVMHTFLRARLTGHDVHESQSGLVVYICTSNFMCTGA